MSAKADTLCWQSDSPEETVRIGEAIGRALVGGLAIGLIGPLGSGKTQLVKGIAQGNTTTEPAAVTSPTFVLVNEYSGRFSLFHLDVYRLNSPQEMLALGFDEFFSPEAVVIVEWADRVRDQMPSDTLWITLSATGENTRQLELLPCGSNAVECIQRCDSLGS